MMMTNLMPKPENSNWTDDQWKAVAVRGTSVLVAAAAGSGKTAVLVERIIRRISDPQEPMDVDRLLVATFTKAAAAEMRHRISDALEKALTADPGSEHLRRQLALIPRAFITTLHSFCMEVIQKHYQSIGLDPGFRIANETESALLRQELLEELLEERYGEALEGEPFWLLADTFSGDKNDEGLFRLVQRLYDDSRSHPWPEHWLASCVRMFEERLDTEDHPWLASLRAAVKLELQGMEGLLREAVRLAAGPGGPAPYLANLDDDLAVVGHLLDMSEESSWGLLYNAFQGAAFGKLKPCKGEQVDKTLQEQVKDLRNAAKDKLAQVKEEWFARSLEEYARELAVMAPLMQALADLVTDFGESYKKAKSDKGLVDFADLEHYCLQILCGADSEPGKPQPSAAALEYREQFVEVMLDEYQDTNRVQETIVALISREEPGNRFMVGDVKQSIYRFRLAEPGLFQEKYKSFRPDGILPGQRIDLARNFRSRPEVVDGTNYIFRQVMKESVGEIDYDERAELVYGAAYPEAKGRAQAAELVLIDRSATADPGEEPTADSEGEPGDAAGGIEGMTEAKDLETAQLEGRLLAERIRLMMGADGGGKYQVLDKQSKEMRDVTYRDIVVLLRATQQWAPVLIEELRQQGIPAYAELNTGYFTATEVQVVLSLLKIIDNPYQDIPLAGVLRSPLVGLSEEELAAIRIARRNGSYFDAVRAYVRGTGAVEEPGPSQGAAEPARALYLVGKQSVEDKESSLRSKLERFLAALAAWRMQSLQGPLAELIWEIYRETGYFDFVGGLPGGEQRQANLRALYDRAKQYEATSLRGLFRFLRFVERMQDTGGDLGTARALGEQEDVVRIMTIHKSKGLEFPVVFVAGCGKMFNRRDLTDAFLLHKELGFGPKLLEHGTRVSYPTLPWLAIKQKIRMEMLAEEMRVLYVALTRAKEKLILIASVRGLEKLLGSWARYVSHSGQTLPDDTLAAAKCYLDWIGPAIMRHPDGETLRQAIGLEEELHPSMRQEASRWTIQVFSPDRFAYIAQAAPALEAVPADPRRSSLLRLEPVDGTERWEQEVWGRLSWEYGHQEATQVFSKTSVTELKRLSEHERLLELFAEEPAPVFWNEEGLDSGAGETLNGRRQQAGGGYRPLIVRRPRFLEQREVNAAERGSVFHALMQQIPLRRLPQQSDIEETLADMVRRELLTEAQQVLVDPQVIVSFFASDLGARLLSAQRVYRELPFSFGMPAADVYGGENAGLEAETVMLQGVIDCLIDEGDGYVLVDYKTDRLKGSSPDRIAERYRLQLELYAKAVEGIWKKPVKSTFVYLFDGAHLVEL
ncbi:helicase-exonuclease AddAB subunit AddA [Paenibacillus puerhi]|uniref:helicase-exonuclease AddAB subunit AddA n=1 Tax=Paenibacillus puerhi TaxID=2692622 RepID=UPI002E2AAA88|nr:helicase-exonuclease AddAB subunit AddA [Paenibacillus puerhi]